MRPDDPVLIGRVEQAINECKRISYNPTRFQLMLVEHGAVETLRILLSAKDPSDGFATLFVKGRPDLTAEAIALRPEFQSHFTKEQRDRARQRLAGTPFAIDDV